MLNLVLPKGDIPGMQDYVKFTDVAGTDLTTGVNKNGAMVGGTNNGLKINDGIITGVEYQYASYVANTGSLVISKATLEGVINGKGLQNASQVAASIATETNARTSAVSNLQGQIDALTSSSDVVDIVANKAALNGYDTTKLTKDDIIKVLEDETVEYAQTYYRWGIGTDQTYQWIYIGRTGPYYTKSEVDTRVNNKELISNKVSSISSSSTDEQYPTAKLLYDIVTEIQGDLGDIGPVLDRINGEVIN